MVTFLGMTIICIVIFYFAEVFAEWRRNREIERQIPKNLNNYEKIEYRKLIDRYQNEEIGISDDDEYLKVIKQLQQCGIDDDSIESLIKEAKQTLKLRGVDLTEYLKEYASYYQVNDESEEKWLNVKQKY